MFVTLEGVDGSGKTTVAKELVTLLENEGHAAIYTREPGGNKIAEAIRAVILDRAHTEMDPRTESLLYAAARRQHLVEIIEPALKSGKIVICDRFIDSSIAYQGYARGIEPTLIETINAFAIADVKPDVTFLIDVKPEIGLERIQKDKHREINRLDLESLAFHQSVYEGYQQLAKKDAGRIHVIDGCQRIPDMITEMSRVINGRFVNERWS
ncbi:MAG: dTMP kinase [Defluviitaleaceae bacterium]|nr:dTMP kinase [Defluviitaleaceae bacterium]